MKKNILISVYNMEIGGIERSLINMLENFNFDQYNVDLLIFHHTGDLLNLIPKQVNILPQIGELSVFRKPISQCIREGYYLFSLLRVISKYAAKIRGSFKHLNEGSGYIQMQLILKYASYFIPVLEKAYDVAISFSWPHDILANKVKARKKIAWIHTDYSKLEIDNQLDLSIWNKFDYIASVSDTCKDSFLCKYPNLKDKVIVVENITSPSFIKKMAKEESPFHKSRDQIFHIVSVGRLSFVKGYDLAVEALKVLHERGLTNIKWYIIGYGGFENELKELIAKNNLKDHFILLGKKTNPYPYINECDLYVQPSRYEGKAVTVTEAKILGKPIIITNYPTAKSQIDHGVEGVICELNVQGLANEIEKFYHNRDLKEKLIHNLKGKDFNNHDELEKLYKIIS
ncbi:MAG: glycosyltransferase [Bacillota bacterium]|nr:glycosyltransferase [Bacillota bacterium]